jgi:RNA-directed DNA polymerase
MERNDVLIAWQAVKQAGGSGGHDGQTIEFIGNDYKNHLYKIWNRLTSGSYMAQPVKLVAIPKAKGGLRILGIPTVTDRIAQMAIKNRLEPVLEPHFHSDSYAYRANKSAIDAVGVTRERCFKSKWVIDMDIKGFFDALDHDLLLEMVEKYTDDEMILLYVKRFLKAKGITPEGEEVERDQGTPQGGVISPLLANLYLHEVFDSWISASHSHVQFERYADDIIVHCVSEKQAKYMLDKIAQRMAKYNLELHPDKTRIVYVGKDGRGDGVIRSVPRKFIFLGYDFKPRSWRGKNVFSPGIGLSAKKMIRDKMKLWRLRHKLHDLTLEEIAKLVNPVIRGWIQYYGHYRRSELYAVVEDINAELVRWLKKKYKKIRNYNQAWGRLHEYKSRSPTLFCHWHMVKSPTRAV